MLRARAAALVFAMAAWGVAPRESAASPQDVFGFGPRSSAMAGPGAALGAGYETVHANPALLSLEHERALEVGIQSATFDLRVDGERRPYEALKGLLIGATLPIPLGGPLADRIAFGLGFYTPFDLIVRGRILYPETPQFPLADRTQSVAVQAGLGVHVWDGLRIGGGFSALAALTGAVLVAQDNSGRLGTNVENTLVASYAPIVGASYDFLDDWRVGLTYRGELIGRFNVVIEVKDLGSLTVPPLNVSGTAQYDPHQIQLEFARVTGPVRFAVSATYKHWQDYPGLPEPTVRCPDDPVTGLPTECGALGVEDPDYGPTVVPRVSVEGVLEPSSGLRMLLRAGYAFEPTGAPEEDGAPNVFDEHRSILGVGYGLELGDPLPPLRFDGFAQLQALHGRDHDKPDGTTRTTSGFIVAAGATGGVTF